jgi:hypothetical protein
MMDLIFRSKFTGAYNEEHAHDLGTSCSSISSAVGYRWAPSSRLPMADPEIDIAFGREVALAQRAKHCKWAGGPRS